MEEIETSPTITDSPSSEPAPPSSTPVFKFLLIGVLAVVVVIFVAWNIQVFLSNKASEPGKPIQNQTSSSSVQDITVSSLSLVSPKNDSFATNNPTFAISDKVPANSVVAIVNKNGTSPDSDAFFIPAGSTEAQAEHKQGSFGTDKFPLEVGLNQLAIISFDPSGKLEEKLFQVLRSTGKEDLSNLVINTVAQVNKVSQNTIFLESDEDSPTEFEIEGTTKFISLVKTRTVKTLRDLRPQDEVAFLAPAVEDRAPQGITSPSYIVLLPSSKSVNKSAVSGKVATIESNESGDQLLISSEGSKNLRVTVSKTTSIAALNNGQIEMKRYEDLKNGQKVAIIGTSSENGTITASKILIQ